MGRRQEGRVGLNEGARAVGVKRHHARPVANSPTAQPTVLKPTKARRHEAIDSMLREC